MTEEAKEAKKIRLDDIEPNPVQPRKQFDKEALEELAQSIKSQGLKQRLIVRPIARSHNKYQLVDGERRFRACKLIALEHVPVEIRYDVKTDEDAAFESFVINNERSNYSAQDRDAYIYNLYKSTKLSTRKLAEKLGKHHSYIDHCIEAHRFREKLPPTLVGSLELSHTSLKNTAMIKDDQLRIRLLQALQEGKIKPSETPEIVKVLKDAPRQLYEAYFCDLMDWPDVVYMANFTDGHKPDVLGFFAREMPYELKKDVINEWPDLHAGILPELLEWELDRQAKGARQYIEWHIELNPHKDANYVRRYAEKQIKKDQKEYRALAKNTLINFKKKYQQMLDANPDKRFTISINNFWIEVFHWIANSVMAIQQTEHLKDDIDTRIAIVDMLYTKEILFATFSGAGDMEGSKRLDKVRVPDDDIEEETSEEEESPTEYEVAIIEEASNAKARAQHVMIEKMMSPTLEQEEETNEED